MLNQNLNQLKIAHLNIQSVKNKIEELKNYLIINNIDIISLNETMLKSKNIFKINNYNCVRCDRKHKRGGGVCLLIHKSIDYNVIDLNQKDDIEYVAIKINNI